MKYDKSKTENKDKKKNIFLTKLLCFDFPACPNYQLSIKLIILLDK